MAWAQGGGHDGQRRTVRGTPAPWTSWLGRCPGWHGLTLGPRLTLHALCSAVLPSRESLEGRGPVWELQHSGMRKRLS